MKNKIDKGKSINNNIMHNLKVWIIFIILDFLITGWFYYPTFASDFDFIHKALFVGLSDAYWFLPVLIISQLILRPFFKKNKMYLTFVIGLILYLFAMTHDSYSFLFINSWIYELSGLHTQIFIWPQGGLVESIMFMSMGAIVCTHKEKLYNKLKDKNAMLIIGIILLTVLLIVEVFFTQNHGAYDTNCYLTLILLPLLILIWAIVIDPIKFDAKILGSLSIYIYMIHPIIVSLMRMTPFNTIIQTLVAIFVSIFLSFIVLKIIEKVNSKKEYLKKN